MNARMRALAALAAAFLTGGCAKMESAPAAIAQFFNASPQEYTSRTLDAPALKAYMEQLSGTAYAAWPIKQWTVDQLTLAAFYYHPEKSAAETWALRHRVMSALVDYYAANQYGAYDRTQKEVLKSIMDIFEQRSAAGQGLNLNASQILFMYQQALLAEKQAQVNRLEAQGRLAEAVGVPMEAIARAGIVWPEVTVTDNDAKLLTAQAREDAARTHSQLRHVPAASMTQAQFNELQGGVINRMELAQARYRAAREKLKAADGLLAAVKAKAAELPNQVGEGELSKLPSLLAQSNVDLTSLNRLEAQVEWLRAKVELEYALETPLFGEPAGMDGKP